MRYFFPSILVVSVSVSAAAVERVAILAFRNEIQTAQRVATEIGMEVIDHDFDYLEGALPEMLTTDISRLSGIRLVERIRVEGLRDEIQLSATGAIDASTRQRAGRATSADTLVYGVLQRRGNSICAKVFIESVFNGRRSQKLICQSADLFAWETAIAQSISQEFPKVSSVTASTVKGTLAVLPLNDYAKDAQGFTRRGMALSDYLSASLANQVSLTMVERTRIKDVLAELKLQHSGAVDETTALKMGRLLGARYILFGSFVTSGNRGRLDAHLSDVESGKTIGHARAMGKTADLIALADALAQEMKGFLQ